MVNNKVLERLYQALSPCLLRLSFKDIEMSQAYSLFFHVRISQKEAVLGRIHQIVPGERLSWQSHAKTVKVADGLKSVRIGYSYSYLFCDVMISACD
jgi:hypothetical protein